MKNKTYIIVALVTISVITLSVVLVKNIKIGEIVPTLGITSYGSLIFDHSPEGILCWNSVADRVEFDYTSVSGSKDYQSGYITLKADEGVVDKITCTVIDNQFIEVRSASPTEAFENAGFEGYGPLQDGESLTFIYHITVVGGLSWTDNSEKSITLSCTADLCETTVGLGSCDLVTDIDFLHSTSESCS